jgi:hypothetical protein
MLRSSSDLPWRIKRNLVLLCFLFLREHSEIRSLDDGIYQFTYRMCELQSASSLWNSLWPDIPTCLVAVCLITALWRRIATAVVQIEGTIHDAILLAEIAVLRMITSRTAD